MGRRLNTLAAKIRILQRTIAEAAQPITLQSKVLELHVDLLGHTVHFGSRAVDLCKSKGVISLQHHTWARQVHKDAASERHNLQPTSQIGECENVVNASLTEARFEERHNVQPLAGINSVANVPLPSNAKGHHCAALEAVLKTSVLDPSTQIFVPYSGQGHIIVGSSWQLNAQPRPLAKPAIFLI